MVEMKNNGRGAASQILKEFARKRYLLQIDSTDVTQQSAGKEIKSFGGKEAESGAPDLPVSQACLRTLQLTRELRSQRDKKSCRRDGIHSATQAVISREEPNAAAIATAS